METKSRRAIGIIRVSQPKGREGPSYASPKDQRAAIEEFCTDQGWRLVVVHDEQHVSGNALLEDRPGLSQAVAAVLTGAADVIVGAHSERLWWSHEVRAQVLRLVEGAGEVWAVDSGRLSNGTAAEDFSGEVRTSADRFSRRQNAEKSMTAVKRAIARGVAPWPSVPPGYLRREDGVLERDPVTAPVVAEAFRMRADGSTVADVRDYLATHGIDRSYHGVTSMLANRIYLGEIHFGGYEPNLTAHEAIVDRALWNRVQRAKVSRGRRAKSERLLARLAVLRCGTCGARMVVGTAHHGQYALYRCPPTGDCPRRVTVSAELAEQTVVEAVREAVADAEGRASVEDNARQAEADLERAQRALKAAIRAFTGLDDEPDAVERLAELRAARDEAEDRVEHLSGHRSVLTINAAADWDRLSLDARRALIRAVVAEVRVMPGRGADRVQVYLVSECASRSRMR